MKHTSRKLLSLLMAFAIVLSLVPATALAADGTLTLNKATLDLQVGGKETLSVTGTSVSGLDVTGVTWSSGDTNVATVDNTSGEVTAVAAGTAKITATMTVADGSDNAGTYTGECTVSVTAATVAVQSVAVSPKTESVEVGKTKKLSATVSPNNATNATVTWKSDKENVATVATDGTVTGVAAGTAVITATADGKSDTCTVTVTAAPTPATGVVMDSSNPTSVKVGQTGIVFKASLTPAGSTGTIAWSSSNEDVAVINSSTGAVTAKAAGKTTITAKVSDTVYTTAQLEVTSATTTVTASITPAKPTVAVGKTTNLTISTTPTNADYDSVEWTITPAGGSVEESSKTTTGTNKGTLTLTGKTAGYVTVSAVLKKNGVEVAKAGGVSVTVTNPTAATGTLSLNPNPLNLTNTNQTATLTATFTGTLPDNATNYYVKFTKNDPYGILLISDDDPMLNTNKVASTRVTGQKSGTATITATLYRSGSGQVAGVDPVTCTVNVNRNYYIAVTSGTPSANTTVSLSNYNASSSNYYRTFAVTPYYNGSTVSNGVSVSYEWTVNGYTVQTSNTYYANQYTLYANNQYLTRGSYNTLRCTATFSGVGMTTVTDSIEWTISTDNYYSDFSVSATVYDGNNGYALSEIPDEGNTSIATQIQNAVAREYGSTSYRYYTVRFDTTGYSSNDYGYLNASTSTYYDSDLSKVVFTPRKSVTSGSVSASYTFTVYIYNSYSTGTSNYDRTMRGTLNFTIKPGTGSSGDINYSAELGSNVSFPVDDFEDFWYSMYNRGTLSHVTFGTVSGGTVYNSAGKNVGSSSYYVNPTRNQNELDGVYFAPSSTTSRTATTVRIPFTATGTTGSGSSSTTSRSGTIVITYLSAAASTINVTTSANGIATLRAQDFIDAYKAAVKTNTNPTNLTIKFQSVPSYGTLTYRDSSKSNSRDVKLTSSNIKNYSFTTKTSGSNQLGDVTYTSGSNRTETISYIGYIGNTATFSGDVTFNAVTAPTNVTVTLPTCYTTAGTALSSSVFTNANAALLSASYVTLGTPRLGTLKSSVGPTTSAIQMSSLGYVTYVPSGTNGTDSFTFAAYNSSNQVVASGTVTVVVSLPATTGSITSITQFNDIPAAGGTADWYRTQLTYLISKGMINGKGNGKFGPEETLEYSEALKFIMNAAGIVESESKTPGTNWAQNYKNTAVQRGWMASTVDLTKPITRDAMAELTARVLGIPAGTGASPFSDSSNAWAAALYNAKIVIGSDNSAKPAFRGSDNLTRAEMVVLVYRMYQYSGK